MTETNDRPTFKIEMGLQDFVDFDYLEANVINRMADVAMSKLTGGHMDSFHKMATTAIEQAINDRLSKWIEERLDKPFPQRDRYGEITGPERSLSDLLAEACDKAMEEPVTADGRRDTCGPGYRTKQTRLEWIAQTLATKGITKAAEDAARKVNAEAKESVKAAMAEAITAQLTKHVK